MTIEGKPADVKAVFDFVRMAVDLMEDERRPFSCRAFWLWVKEYADRATRRDKRGRPKQSPDYELVLMHRVRRDQFKSDRAFCIWWFGLKPDDKDFEAKVRAHTQRLRQALASMPKVRRRLH